MQHDFLSTITTGVLEGDRDRKVALLPDGTVAPLARPEDEATAEIAQQLEAFVTEKHIQKMLSGAAEDKERSAPTDDADIEKIIAAEQQEKKTGTWTTKQWTKHMFGSAKDAPWDMAQPPWVDDDGNMDREKRRAMTLIYLSAVRAHKLKLTGGDDDESVFTQLLRSLRTRMRELYEKIRNWIPESVLSVVGTVSGAVSNLSGAALDWLTQNSLRGGAEEGFLSSLGLSDVDTSSMTNMEKLKFYGILLLLGAMFFLLFGSFSFTGAAVASGAGLLMFKLGQRWYDTTMDDESDATEKKEHAGEKKEQAGEKKGPKEVTYRGETRRAIGVAGIAAGIVGYVKSVLIFTPTYGADGVLWGYSYNWISLLSGWFTSLVAGPWNLLAMLNIPYVGSFFGAVGSGISMVYTHCIFSYGIIALAPLLYLAHRKVARARAQEESEREEREKQGRPAPLLPSRRALALRSYETTQRILSLLFLWPQKLLALLLVRFVTSKPAPAQVPNTTLPATT